MGRHAPAASRLLPPAPGALLTVLPAGREPSRPGAPVIRPEHGCRLPDRPRLGLRGPRPGPGPLDSAPGAWIRTSRRNSSGLGSPWFRGLPGLHLRTLLPPVRRQGVFGHTVLRSTNEVYGLGRHALPPRPDMLDLDTSAQLAYLVAVGDEVSPTASWPRLPSGAMGHRSRYWRRCCGDTRSCRDRESAARRN